MEQGRIVIITGAPGTGKSTVSALVAAQSSMEKSLHIHTDDFYHYLSKGAIPPHLPASHAQNAVVMEALSEAAKCFAKGGYDVIVDGIIGPWFLEPWLRAAQADYEVHYIILRASRDETMARALSRAKLDQKTNRELVDAMWAQFCDIGAYEANVIDTTGCSISASVSAVKDRIARRTALLPA